MADEIIQQLGFNVEEALTALQRLDTALQAAGSAFGKFGAALDSFNARASAALATMRSLASAATRLSTAMQTAPAGAPIPGAAATPAAPQLWLPPGLQSSAQQATQAFNNVGAAAQQAGQQATTGMNNAANATAGATKQSAGLIVSWNTLARVVVTQLIVRTMSQIRDALRESVEASIEFQRRIAEIQTVSPRFGASLAESVPTRFESLTREVAGFAKEFNIPLGQATEGLYQTISDQFVQVTDRTNVMTAAVKLAKVGVMDLGAAVTLVTGTLNAYGMASAQAESVVAKYFETIRLGHVRGEELAAVMGQLHPIARELGLSLDEVNAAMVSMTIGGMDAHKSATALRGAMLAFIKPSEDMKKVVREMGFGDPAQLMAAKGFQGALQAVADAADGAGVKIAQSVRNVRALTAELRLSSEEGAQKYQEALKAMAAATPEALDKIFKEFRSTGAERVTQQINALKINLTQDFGAALTDVLASVMRFVGGADSMAAALQAIAAAAIPLAAALGTLALGFVAVNVALGPVGWALIALVGAVTLATGAITYSTMEQVYAVRKAAEEDEKAVMKQIRAREALIRKNREAAEETGRKGQQEFVGDVAVLMQQYNRIIDANKEKNKQMIADDRQVMEAMIAGQERVVAAYRNAANAAVRIVRESQQEQVTLQAQYEDKQFKFHLRTVDAETKADRLRYYGLRLAKEAANALASARTPEAVQDAKTVYARAEAHLQEAASIAQGTRNLEMQDDIERAGLRVMQQRIDAQRELERIQAAQALAHAKQAAEEQKTVSAMKALMPGILKDLELFDKQGPKDTAQLETARKRLFTNFAEFRRLFMGSLKEVDVATLLNMDQLQRRVTLAIEGGVSKVQIQQFDTSLVKWEELRAQITRGVGPVDVIIRGALQYSPELRAETKGMSAEEIRGHLVRRREEDVRTLIRYDELQQQVDARRKGAQSFTELAAKQYQKVSLDTIAQGAKSRQAWYLSMAAVGASEAGVAFDAQERMKEWEANAAKVRAEFETRMKQFVASKGAMTDQGMKDIYQAYGKFVEVFQPEKPVRERLEYIIKAAQSALAETKGKEGAEAAREAIQSAAVRAMQELRDIDAALKAAKEAGMEAEKPIRAAGEGAKTAKAALQDVSMMDMSGIVNGIRGAADAMWDLATASWTVEPPTAMTAAHGGKAWRFLAGGGPVGTDVIPAMLSPGEVVINAASARNFASQLTAINAGVQPVYRSEGGSVTNIGDINVRIEGKDAARLTPRGFWEQVRREARRGTVKV